MFPFELAFVFGTDDNSVYVSVVSEYAKDKYGERFMVVQNAHNMKPVHSQFIKRILIFPCPSNYANNNESYCI